MAQISVLITVDSARYITIQTFIYLHDHNNKPVEINQNHRSYFNDIFFLSFRRS